MADANMAGADMAGGADNTGAGVLAAALDAARAGDLERLSGLVDWPLAGAGTIAQALPGVLERDRAELTESGLSELDSAATEREVLSNVVGPLAARLAGAREIRPAGAEASAAALEILRVPAPPPGLTAAQYDRLVELSARVAAIRDVYLVVDDWGELPVALAADSGMLVPVLPD